VSARSTRLPATTVRSLLWALGGAAALLLFGTGIAQADGVHGPFDPTTKTCANCHRAHTAQSPNLVRTAVSSTWKSPTTTQCVVCHDGTGAKTDVASQFTDSSVPQNDVANREFYRHDVMTVTTHTLAENDEFAGTMNRHSECTDCHNPHDLSVGTASTSTTTDAWTASGAIRGASGVSVTNAGSMSGPLYIPSPTYAFLTGNAPSTITYEYQLCFKCHSGRTTLLPDIPGQPSKDMLDVAKEFDPAAAQPSSTLSFHPVEARGRNTTAAMEASLSGGSTYKMTNWTFSTATLVRCTNCHSNAIADPKSSTAGAGSDLPSHASPYRGLLVQKYEDRVLPDTGIGFQEQDFALCFMCHSDSPFLSGIGNGRSSAATNFSQHYFHMTALGDGADGARGTTGTIDTPGAGPGNALCAECHFRPHSTQSTPTQYAGLVAFAPTVTANTDSTGPLWIRSTEDSGSCTLTCHGHEHVASPYSRPTP
jgi:predicted CXXCH cytochrome family protein